MKKPLLVTAILFTTYYSNGQITPRIKPVKPASPSATQTNRNNGITSPAISIGRTEYLFNSSKLHFANQLLSDADCKGPKCYYWEYVTSVWRDANNTPGSSNWKEQLLWRRIPQNTVYGKYEVSLSPFTGTNEILQSGIIETNGRDSVLFTINYTDFANKVSGRTNQPAVNQKSFSLNKGNTLFKNVNKKVYDALSEVPSSRKFFIRIVPLDAGKSPINNISNEVTLIQTWVKFSQAKPNNAPTIYNDYTITAVKYVPVHFPNAAFFGCNVVTGYNQNMFNNVPGGQNFAIAFMQAFPVGKTICPQYDTDDKPWYKKAFNGVTGFVEKAVDGAANFYNDTKGYIKSKVSSAICSGAPADAKDKCESVAGYAFDGAMAAAGIPPSLPNTDDLTKMAEGQVVDLACDKIEKESGVPIPDFVKDEMKKEFHQQVKAASDNRMVDCGFVKVKPHPEGFFQTAFLEIEVTRTGNIFKNKAIAGIGIENKCERSDIYCENCNPYEKDNQKLRFNLFERSFTEVPFLSNVGDKIKLIVVLKPQESWIHKNSSTGKIRWIEKAYPLNEFFTPVEPTYEGAASSPGFNILSNKSFIKFDFGPFKLANGVTTTFYHQ